MTILHLIRHGRASALEADYDKLQPLGELQARLLGEHLAARAQHFDAVYVGPLVRQLETLRLMREAAGPLGAAWPAATLLDGLAEAPFEALMKQHVRPRLPHDPSLQAIATAVRGAVDETARSAALSTLFDYMAVLWRRGEVRAEGLESPESFEARVSGVLVEMARREGQGREVAVVTSNGVIGELLDKAGLRPGNGAVRHRLHNSSVSLLELRADGIVPLARDLTEHLRDPQHFTLL
jgi:broad specificity phosphatase PhoE